MARATWKGVLQISLVQIPIKIYPATEASETLSFNQLHGDCQSRLTTQRWCPTCAREVKAEEIVKGFEFEKGKYVLLDEAELDAVQPASRKVINLTQFAAASELPFIAIDRAYFVAPDGEAAVRAYQVVQAAMAKRVGIGTIAMYGRESLVAVGPQPHRGLMLFTLHHAAELRTADALPPHYSNVSEESDLARRVIAALQRPLNLADFTDAYQVDLRRLIAAKIAGEDIVVPPAVEASPPLHLRDALTQSLLAVSAAKKIPAKVTVPAKQRRA